jgi:hypothetical protein
MASRTVNSCVANVLCCFVVGAVVSLGVCVLVGLVRVRELDEKETECEVGETLKWSKRRRKRDYHGKRTDVSKTYRSSSAHHTARGRTSKGSQHGEKKVIQ